jgi:hypothetical protein
MAHHEPGAAHASADDEYRVTPPGSGHEHTDARARVIAKFGLWLVVSAVIIHVGIIFMFNMFAAQRAETAEPEFPLATGQEQRLPSGPRLQRFPANEVYEFQLRERAELDNYGWIDRNAGTVHIPIDQAMRLVVERGLVPSRPQPDAAAAPAPAADVIPADSSAGRTMERRR